MKYLLLMIILLNACGSEKKEIKSREACKSDSCSVQSEDNVLDAANNPTSTPSPSTATTPSPSNTSDQAVDPSLGNNTDQTISQANVGTDSCQKHCQWVPSETWGYNPGCSSCQQTGLNQCATYCQHVQRDVWSITAGCKQCSK